MYLSRTLCNVLEEIRECDKTKNFSYLLGLVEEAQVMANRMEAKLEQIDDYDQLKESYKDLQERKKHLKDEIRAKGGKVNNWE